jgi:predicted nucleic acid-binding protein
MSYIDTSILVAYYCPERLSRAAQSAIRRAAMPAISALSEVEFISALAMKRRTGKINESTARRILSLFKKHRADHIYRLVPIEAREFAVATDWLESFHTSLRALDALHLAAAFTSGLILTTADKGLAESATLLGVKHELLS